MTPEEAAFHVADGVWTAVRFWMLVGPALFAVRFVVWCLKCRGDKGALDGRA